MKNTHKEMGTTIAVAALTAWLFHVILPDRAVAGAALGMAAALAGSVVAVAVRAVGRRGLRLRRLAFPLALSFIVVVHYRAFVAAWPPAPWAAGVTLALVAWVVAGNVVYRVGFPLLIALSTAAGALLL